MSQTQQLTNEEIFLGRVYSFIHQRAIYLRQRDATTSAQNTQGKDLTPKLLSEQIMPGMLNQTASRTKTVISASSRLKTSVS